jgi:ATP adenylyltransferase
MVKKYHNADRKANIHAPWRMEYIHQLGGKPDGCFLCAAHSAVGQEDQTLLLWRSPRCLVVLNRFPYTGGHLLIAPIPHKGELDDLDSQTLTEMMELARDCTKILTHVLKAGGFNVGINLGRCAGAGLPGHLHLHVVPRWSGDTNFMSVLGDIRVIPQALAELRQQLLAAGAELGLPKAALAAKPQ